MKGSLVVLLLAERALRRASFDARQSRIDQAAL